MRDMPCGVSRRFTTAVLRPPRWSLSGAASTGRRAWSRERSPDQGVGLSGSASPRPDQVELEAWPVVGVQACRLEFRDPERLGEAAEVIRPNVVPLVQVVSHAFIVESSLDLLRRDINPCHRAEHVDAYRRCPG